MSLLSFRKVSETNLDRALVWHPKGLEEWSPLEWGGALAGEAGELCNILKKLKRLDTGLQQADNVTKSELLNKAGKEIADVYLYLDLIASRLGLDIAEEIVKKFNETSEKEGFPHRL